MGVAWRRRWRREVLVEDGAGPRWRFTISPAGGKFFVVAETVHDGRVLGEDHGSGRRLKCHNAWSNLSGVVSHQSA